MTIATKNETITAIFPRMNKQNTLAEYKEELFAGSYSEKVEIVKEVILSVEDYDAVTNSFLTDNAELWEKIGGRRNTKGIDHRYDFTEEEKLEWMENCVTMVVRVSLEVSYDETEYENRHRIPFLVNTEGHEYARYVGFLTSDILVD